MNLIGLQCNFQGVIRDCQITCGLIVQEVQFYTLSFVGVVQDVYYPSMFAECGNGLHDALNFSINGLASVKVISVPCNDVLKEIVGCWWEYTAISTSFYSLIRILTTTVMITRITVKRLNLKKNSSIS